MDARWITLLMMAGFVIGVVFFAKYFFRFLEAYRLSQHAETEQKKQQAEEASWQASRGMTAMAFCLLAYVLILGKYLTTTLE